MSFKIQNFSTEQEAIDAGFATYNKNEHLAVELGTGNSTITVKTPEGKMVTLFFGCYAEDGSAQHIDIKEHTAPEIKQEDVGECFATKSHVGRPRQRVALFAGGGTAYHTENEKLAKENHPVTLTTILLTSH